MGDRISETLIDIILTNVPDDFARSGVFDPGLSDHALIYTFMKERMAKSRTKVINLRSRKDFDKRLFKENLASAPWHVAEILITSMISLNFLAYC